MNKKILITIGVIFLLIAGFAVISVSRYISASDRSERDYYSRAAGMPSFAGCVEDNGFGKYRNRSYVFLQTQRFSSIGELCNNLPAGFTGAVNKALTSGKAESGYDLKDKPVTLYVADPELLPLREKESNDKFECHYCVMEYSDNTYRFVLITEIAFTR